VAFEYGWEGYEVYEPRPVPALALSTAPGRYRYNAELAVTVNRQDDRLFLRYAGGEPEELLYVGDQRFMRRGRTAPIIFPEQDGEIVLAFPLGGGDLQVHERLQDGERLPREYLDEGLYYAGLGAYRKLLEAHPDEPAVSEGYLNSRGLNALETNPEHGIMLLRVAAALYPDSANTWDSLGYAYRHVGDTEQAIANYRKALRRDPEFPSAVEAMAELTGRTP
jgi:tetratricopeptide (TPR) repeat protein